MAWGDSFKSAWAGATQTARNAAASVAAGATSVGMRALETVQAGASRVADAGRFAANMTQQAAAWVGDTVKAGVRGALSGIATGALNAATAVKDGISSAASAVRNAFNRIKQQFGIGTPEEPCIPCAQAAADAKNDGALIGNKNDQCQPLTSSGQGITSDAIANAKANGYTSQSDCCAAARAGGNVPSTIYYVNGINTPRDAHCTTIRAIGDSTCANVVGIYNATDGFVGDALQTGKDRQLIKAAAAGARPQAGDGRNPAVDTLSDVVYREVMDGNPPTIWAHSQGGAVTSLALYSANNRLAMAGRQEGLSGMTVKSFGSAAPFWPDGPAYEHYVHVNDATPVNFGLGDNPSSDGQRAGRGADVIRFSGNGDGPYETTNPETTFFGPVTATANHSIENTYVRMQDQLHGACSGKP